MAKESKNDVQAVADQLAAALVSGNAYDSERAMAAYDALSANEGKAPSAASDDQGAVALAAEVAAAEAVEEEA